MPAVPNESVVVLGDWQSHIAKARRRSSGKERVTLEVKSDLTIAAIDPVRLGAPVAEALAEAVRQGIKSFAGSVSERTEDFRKSALSSFNAGARWARKRYAGGKIGAMIPWQSGSQMLNDSGRLAKGIVARLARGGPKDDEGKWTINVPANRLTQDQPGLRARMLDLLAPIVAGAVNSQIVQNAILGSAKNAVKVGSEKTLQDLLRSTLAAISAAKGLSAAAEEFSEEPEKPKPPNR